MRNMINNKITEVYREFSKEINKLSELCCLHHPDISEKVVPTYRDKINQQLYLLRTYPAYLFEYYRMYRKLYKSNFLHAPFKILSIGAGNGIDYSAMKLVRQDFKLKTQMEYISMDNIYWNYRTPIDPEHGRYITGDITMLEKLNREDYNIFIFPKSIWKYSNQQFKNLIDCFINTNLTEKRIVFLSSIQDTDKNLVRDITRLEDLLSAVCKAHRYKSYNRTHQYYYFSDQYYGIKAVEERFNYPNEVLRFVSNLHNKCNNFNKNMYRCMYDCKLSLNITPILTLQQIKYQMICLEKDTN